MNSAKIALLFLISFIGTGAVVYEIHNRRPAPGKVVGTAPSPSGPAATAPPIIASAGVGDAGKIEQNRGLAPDIPATGWGREDPFLTLEEIKKRHEVPADGPTTPPPPPPPSPPPPMALPEYAITGIISGEQGRWAIVDGRLFRPGERIGTETLKEVKDRGVVLEHEGQMRELPLKRLEETAAAAPPKKEAKQ
jgi:hypothetical protein